MELPFILPPLGPNGIVPVWVGNGFRVGDELLKVAEYNTSPLGWNDELTFFHEESAGDDHFIDRASRDHAISQLKQHISVATPTLLEIGCSSGIMLHRLRKEFPQAFLIGSDIVEKPLDNLADTLTDVPLLRFDITKCPLPNCSIDAIVMLNVLEHIEDDQKALSHVFRILKPGGLLVLEVPAGPKLYDVYDKLLLHYRRYTLKGLRPLLKKQGFRIVKQSHLGCFLYPLFWCAKRLNQIRYRETTAREKQAVKQAIHRSRSNPILHGLAALELKLGKIISYPFGIRCLMSCVK